MLNNNSQSIFFERGGKKWEVCIGLEVHSRALLQSKLFSGASAEYGGLPNSNVSPTDAAMPGTLPTLNIDALRIVTATCIALGGEPQLFSSFDRKHYFYPDLPSGYQITQFFHPIAKGGFIDVSSTLGRIKRVRVRSIHLEQDAGKSVNSVSGDKTYVDLNRAGSTLMELVTMPDMRSPEEAVDFIRRYRNILRYVGVCDGDMEKGSLRCDANVSVRILGDEEMGTRCEIKNLNSMRNLERAIRFEADRQIDELLDNRTIRSQTLLFDVNSGETEMIRNKESEDDYCYFPEPDLLPVILTEDFVNNIANTMPELPEQRILRYISMGLQKKDAEILIEDMDVCVFFEEVCTFCSPVSACKWITGDLFGALRKSGKSIVESPIDAKSLGGIIKKADDGELPLSLARSAFILLFEKAESPNDISLWLKDNNFVAINDIADLESMVDAVISENADKVEQYMLGKDKLFGFFVGSVMKKAEGKADPVVVNDLLKKKLTKK